MSYWNSSFFIISCSGNSNDDRSIRHKDDSSNNLVNSTEQSNSGEGDSSLVVENDTKFSNKISKKISANDGGMLTLNDEVTLYIPSGSLEQDTEITIEKTENVPASGADGLNQFENGYKFLPEGTIFRIDRPAVLTMKYDSSKLLEKNYDPKTILLYYYDEQQKRYINVSGNVNPESGKITANIEHFTYYLPLARSLKSVGNNYPTVAIQNPVPNPTRQGAPIYIRATALDHDQLGSIAGVTIQYRKLNPGGIATPGPWVGPFYMKQDIRPNSQDSYGYLIPSDFLDVSDMGAGPDIEISVTAVDNLGDTPPVSAT